MMADCWCRLCLLERKLPWRHSFMMIMILYPVQQHLLQLLVDFWRCQGFGCRALLFRRLAVRFFNRFRDNTGRTLQILRHAKRAKFTAWIKSGLGESSLSCECMMCFCKSMHVGLVSVLFLSAVCAEICSTSKPFNHHGSVVDCWRSYTDHIIDLRPLQGIAITF